LTDASMVKLAQVAGKASFTIDASVKGSAKVHDSCRANES